MTVNISEPKDEVDAESLIPILVHDSPENCFDCGIGVLSVPLLVNVLELELFILFKKARIFFLETRVIQLLSVFIAIILGND